MLLYMRRGLVPRGSWDGLERREKQCGRPSGGLENSAILLWSKGGEFVFLAEVVQIKTRLHFPQRVFSFACFSKPAVRLGRLSFGQGYKKARLRKIRERRVFLERRWENFSARGFFVFRLRFVEK